MTKLDRFVLQWEELPKRIGKVKHPADLKVLVSAFKKGYSKGTSSKRIKDRHKFNAHKFVEGFALKRRFSYLIFIPIAIIILMIGFVWGTLSGSAVPGIHPPSPKTNPLKPLKEPTINDEQEAVEDTVVEPVAVSKPSTFVAGNDYAFNNCTFGVANWTSVPAGLGNANEWPSNARAMGFAVSSNPSPGSVGVSYGGWYGHVVYVEAVDGPTLYIKEQNYDYMGSIRERYASASEFSQYITF